MPSSSEIEGAKPTSSRRRVASATRLGGSADRDAPPGGDVARARGGPGAQRREARRDVVDMLEVAHLMARARRGALTADGLASDAGNETPLVLAGAVEEEHAPPRNGDPAARAKRRHDATRGVLAHAGERVGLPRAVR